MKEGTIMAIIKPIRPLRFTDKKNVETCVCPPYDIISDKEREEIVKRNNHNIVVLEKPEGENKYENAASLLKEWINEGILKRDDSEGIFVYQEKFSVAGKDYVFDGLVCLAKLYEFSEKVVLPHEETLSKAKQDRLNLLTATHCNFSSVYSLYMDEEKKVEKIIEKAKGLEAECSFTDAEEVTHTLWKITDKDDIASLVEAFADKQLFIADGHHRYETSLNYRRICKENGISDLDTDYILMTLVDMDNKGLVIMPTHRVITEKNLDLEAIKEKCKSEFEISEMDDISKAEEILASLSDIHAFALYSGGKGFTLFKRKEDAVIEGHSEAYCGLDVSVLHTLILEKGFGIDKENMANQKSLIYTRSIDEAVSLVQNGEASCSFILNSTKVQQIKAVSLAGDKMPQKSTYFYPKLITGLVINCLEK